MLYTSIVPHQVFCNYLNPIKFHQTPTISTAITTTTHHPYRLLLHPLAAINGEQQEKKTSNNTDRESLRPPIYFNNNQKRTQKIECKEARKERGISSNMWWADLKAALGQRINVEGLVCSVSVVTRKRELALPHVSVRDIRCIDWGALKNAGFQGVVFDKDNTLTVPYTLALWPPLAASVESCKSVFGNNIAVFSNSAGLHEYDRDGRRARALEFVIGIKVIRHMLKKPAGSADEIERQFGCDSSRLIMVGDRPFTDVVYGNKNGFLTILTEPLSLAEEPLIVKQVRKLERALVNRWSKRGVKAPSHKLLPDARQCVKNTPPL